jgi:hypothetical protein
MSVIDKIKTAAADAVNDLTTLDVVTLTGTIDISANVKDGKINLKKVYENVVKNAKGTTSAKAALKVVAFTHLDFDCDSVNFAKEDLTEAQEMLLKAHRETVSVAQETRMAVVKMIKEVIVS